MSDPLSVKAQSSAGDTTPGTLLRRERERRELSVQQAAEDLHLDPWIVEAIEANRFQALGAPVYAKGHLRKYATRLGLGADEVIQRYDALQDRPMETDPIPAAIAAPVRPPRRSFKKPVLTVLALMLVALAVWNGLQFMSRRSANEILQPEPIELSSAPIVRPASSEPVGKASSSSVEQEKPLAGSIQPASSVPTEARAAQASPSETPLATAGTQVQVRLEFSGESWTEIYDAQGARLMYATGTPGRVRTITGSAPLQVTFGAASAVTMEVNGQPAVIPRREGREASRFTIDGDGNLR